MYWFCSLADTSFVDKILVYTWIWKFNKLFVTVFGAQREELSLVFHFWCVSQNTWCSVYSVRTDNVLIYHQCVIFVSAVFHSTRVVHCCGINCCLYSVARRHHQPMLLWCRSFSYQLLLFLFLPAWATCNWIYRPSLYHSSTIFILLYSILYFCSDCSWTHYRCHIWW